MPHDTASEKKPGRPRDERARQCVLTAVREQLRQGSLCGMSMEGIARQAGVGKQTVYRWWPTLADVALEALLEEAGEACPLPDTGNVQEDLRTFLRAAFVAIHQRTGSLLRCLMVEAQRSPEFRVRFRERFIQSRQEALGTLLGRGQAHATELHALIDMVFGSLWYRLLVGHRPLDDAFADELTAAAMVWLNECGARRSGGPLESDARSPTSARASAARPLHIGTGAPPPPSEPRR